MNRGNVIEREHVRLVLLRRGHVLERVTSALRTLLPHSREIARFRRSARLRGWVTARVDVGAIRRSFRIRL
jgi:hypothetical protein